MPRPNGLILYSPPVTHAIGELSLYFLLTCIDGLSAWNAIKMLRLKSKEAKALFFLVRTLSQHMSFASACFMARATVTTSVSYRDWMGECAWYVYATVLLLARVYLQEHIAYNMITYARANNLHIRSQRHS